MDLSQIRELLKIVADSGVAEVEIEEENFKMVVRLNAPNISLQAPPTVQMPQVIPYYPPAYGTSPPLIPPEPHIAPPAPPPAASPPTKPPEPAIAPATETPSTSEHPIKAPIVGTFYRASSPDAEPFVQVGDRVQPGDVLCIIEAMKLMNEIECDTAGTIKQILVDNAEPVEYDQPLFIIEKG